MKVLFVNYHDFSSNSAIHIFHYANNLIKVGVDCAVCVPFHKETVQLIGKPLFSAFNFSDFYGGMSSSNRYSPDIIHAWTPREKVRKFTQSLLANHRCKCVIHLEDNEEAIFSANVRSFLNKYRFANRKIAEVMVSRYYSHPVKSKQFLKQADGITAIIDKLLEFKPKEALGQVIWPGYEDSLIKTCFADAALKKTLGVQDNTLVVAYTGNVHAANKQEVYSLYYAISILNKKEIPVKLIRTGRNYIEFYDEILNDSKDCFVELGFVERATLLNILTLSDVFVQPGKSDIFNDYRFPSKIPDFLASGKAVILPDTNIGRYLTDGVNCLILKDGNVNEICGKLEYAYYNREKCKNIGACGREFALQNLDWYKNTMKLYDFYKALINT